MTESTGCSDLADTVGRLLEYMSAGDAERVLALADDDVVMSIPFQPPGYSTRIEGKQDLRAFLARVLKLFSPFTLHLTETLLVDGGKGVVARYYGKATMVRTGKPYENSYVAIFRFAGGLLTEWTEFANPLILLGSLDAANAERT
jgi:uncharacterized protein